MTSNIEEVYQFYFSKQVIKNVWWAPSVTCQNCANSLLRWESGTQVSMTFGVPMIWNNPIHHNERECYFCIHYTKGHNVKTMSKLKYLSTTYAFIPQPHSEDVPVPIRPSQRSNFNSSAEQSSPEVLVEPPYTASYVSSTVDYEVGHPDLISQASFNDLVRVLYLPKTLGELLGSRLRQWKLLQPGV